MFARARYTASEFQVGKVLRRCQFPSLSRINLPLSFFPFRYFPNAKTDSRSDGSPHCCWQGGEPPRSLAYSVKIDLASSIFPLSAAESSKRYLPCLPSRPSVYQLTHLFGQNFMSRILVTLTCLCMRIGAVLLCKSRITNNKTSPQTRSVSLYLSDRGWKGFPF